MVAAAITRMPSAVTSLGPGCFFMSSMPVKLWESNEDNGRAGSVCWCCSFSTGMLNFVSKITFLSPPLPSPACPKQFCWWLWQWSQCNAAGMKLENTSFLLRKLHLIIYLCTSFYFLVAKGTTLGSETRLRVCICTRQWCLFSSFFVFAFYLVSGFCQNMPNSCLIQWRWIQLLLKHYSMFSKHTWGSCLPWAGLRSSSLQEIQHKQLSRRIFMLSRVCSISLVAGPRLEATGLWG